MAENQEILKLKKEIDKLKKSIKKQRYGLVWMDVPEAFEDDVENKIPVLKDVPELAIKNNDGKPQHILIEGDNYHALTCLNYTHKGKIDVIYIDPPYNTGSDGFRYKDKRIISKFPDGTEVPKDHPFRHSYWLSFMRKRLELAKELLSDEGVIFISIDDNELAQLKLLCNEIFLEKNFLAHINRIQSRGGKDDSKYFIYDNDYLLIYAKKIESCVIKRTKTKIENGRYPCKDNIGNYKKRGLEMGGGEGTLRSRPKMGYSIYYNPKTKNILTKFDYDLDSKEVYKKPDKDLTTKGYICIRPQKIRGEFGRWRWGEETFLNNLENIEIDVRTKRAYTKEREKEFIITPPSCNIQILNTEGTKEVKEILVDENFDFPKPSSLIEFIIDRHTNKDAIVLDFFAGSGTTGHGVLKFNIKDEGKRQFIMVTNNEEKIMEKACYPRIKKVIKGYKNNKGKEIKGLGNSLKYYKTEFIGKNNILDATDEDKIELAQNAGELLAIAENTLELVKQDKYTQLFEDNLKKKYTAVYFREELVKFDKFVEKVQKLDRETTVYMFSWGNDEFIDEFEGNKNIKVKTIPAPILEIYKNIYNLNN
jgi:adenine-specific DNA-methyltransferase